VGLLLSAHFMVGTLLILASGASAITTFTLMFYGQLFLNLNWSLVADITLVKIKIVSITLRPSCRDCGLLSSYSESVSHALSVKRVVTKYCLCLIFLPWRIVHFRLDCHDRWFAGRSPWIFPRPKNARPLLAGRSHRLRHGYAVFHSAHASRVVYRRMEHYHLLCGRLLWSSPAQFELGNCG
jgi:hypothetical protein